LQDFQIGQADLGGAHGVAGDQHRLETGPLFSHGAQALGSGHAGQAEIDDGQVHGLGVGVAKGQGLLGTVRNDDIEPVAFQDGLDEAGDHGLVVHDQYAFGAAGGGGSRRVAGGRGHSGRNTCSRCRVPGRWSRR